ncbi:MAG: hypothetical protein GY881_12910 [Gammaproteobacteria bacterium]|jgi:cytochrome c553|nr:hypothetical protein [Gammaproteobacteria bacterium]MCP4880560.1 hypothetical protein [Gammaproteobacteria bacterium]MDP6166393.1 hypothetical protein [Gammaproteobacteria bacterium]
MLNSLLKKAALACVISSSLAASLAVAHQSTIAVEKVPGAQKAVDLIGMWVSVGAPEGFFTYTDLSGNAAPGNFETDILPLFTEHGIWAQGTASCGSCHSSNSESSLHEMDLTSYAGLMRGGDVLSHPPGVPLFGQGAIGDNDYDWSHSKMKERLRNNRMPPGIQFDITEANRDGPCVKVGYNGSTISRGEYGCGNNAIGMIGAWVDAGAPEKGKVSYGGGKINFTDDILPLFTEHGVWAEGTASCASCHSGNTESSLHEMDLTSYAGMMHGGDVLSHPPGVPLFGESEVGASDYDWSHSKLKSRLRNNRMPPGIEFDITEENRDGPIVVHGQSLSGG